MFFNGFNAMSYGKINRNYYRKIRNLLSLVNIFFAILKMLYCSLAFDNIIYITRGPFAFINYYYNKLRFQKVLKCYVIRL